MPSTYTGLGVDKMATGENAGTWGTATNTNLEILEQISGGYLSQSIASTPTALAVADGTSGNTNQVAHRTIEFTGSIGEATIVTIPLDVQQLYLIKNSSSGAYTVQFKYVTGSDSGVTWSATDKGYKIVYATANHVTNPELVDTGFLSAVVDDTSPQLGGDLDLNGQDIVSTSNADIDIIPNGTGDVNLGADAVQIGDNDANATLTTQGTGDLILNTNNGTNAGNITLADGANGDISFTNNGTGNVVFNDAAYAPETSLTDAATITWDAQAMPITKVTLTDNRILAAPTNSQTGQFVSLLIIQDGSGSRTLTWNAVFEFPLEAAPTLTTTAALADLFVFRYHNSKWLQVGSTLALTVA